MTEKVPKKRAFAPRLTNRKELLLEHLLAFIAEEGFEAITVRAVAVRANVTVGTVQHYFPTKEDMLFAAMEYGRSLIEREYSKVETSISLNTLLIALVPDTPSSKLSRVWLAFVSQAPYNQRFAKDHQARWQKLEKTIALLIVKEWRLSELHAEQLAKEALALVDGLAVAVVTEPKRMPPATARSVIEQWARAAKVRHSSDNLL